MTVRSPQPHRRKPLGTVNVTVTSAGGTSPIGAADQSSFVTPGTYSGPGDVQSGAIVWVGTRAYNSAYAAVNGPLVNAVRSSDSHSCDFLAAANGGVGNTANCSTPGDNGQTASAWSTRATVTGSITLPAGLSGAAGGPRATGWNVLTTTGDGCAPQVGDQVVASGLVSQRQYVITTISSITSCGGGIGSYVLSSNYQTMTAQTVTFFVPLTVTTAYDQSGYNGCASAACNLTDQGNAAYRPGWLWACINAQPCFNFPGTTRTLGLSNSSVSTSQPQPYTMSAVWMIYNSNAAASNSGVELPFVGQLRPVWNTVFMNPVNTPVHVPRISMQAGASAPDPGSPHYIYQPSRGLPASWLFTQTVFNSGTGSLSYNGMTMPWLTSSAINTSALGTSFTLGNDNVTSGTGNNLVGQITEEGFWPTAWTTAQQTDMYNNQVGAYGIPYLKEENPCCVMMENLGGPWMYYGAPWGNSWHSGGTCAGSGGMTAGNDYNNGVWINPATFPNGTILWWQWPNCVANAYYAYPGIIYGGNNCEFYSPCSGNPQTEIVWTTPIQIGNINNFTLTLNMSIQALIGDTTTFDVITEIYPAINPGNSPIHANPAYLCECTIVHHLAAAAFSKAYLDAQPLVATATINGVNWHLVANHANSPRRAPGA